jgi:hypothetical protein
MIPLLRMARFEVGPSSDFVVNTQFNRVLPMEATNLADLAKNSVTCSKWGALHEETRFTHGVCHHTLAPSRSFLYAPSSGIAPCSHGDALRFTMAQSV